MESLYLLIPLSIVIVFIAIWFFFSMSDSGQFDDMVGPAMRVLQDDDATQDEQPANDKNTNTEQTFHEKPGAGDRT